MAQLGKFEKVCTDTSGNSASGASFTIYREGALVNGNQSGTTPLAVTVHWAGKIVNSDTVFINTTTGTTYTANRTSDTVITLSGFAGTLNLTSGDRITPSTNKPTLYGDDTGTASTSNPLTSDSAGYVSCWLEAGSYDGILSGGGLTTRGFKGIVVSGSEKNRIRYADDFNTGASTTGGIQEAINDLPTGVGGTVYLSGKTYTVTSQITVTDRVRLVGCGSRTTIIQSSGGFASATGLVRLGDGTQTRIFNVRLEHLQVDCNDVAASVGVYTTEADEQSGLFNVAVNKYRVYGFQALSSGGGLPARLEVNNCEFYGSTSGSTSGIIWNTIESDSRIVNCTIGSNGAVATDAISLTSAIATIQNLHVEKHTNAVTFNSSAAGSVSNAYGHSTVTTIVNIAANSGAIACFNITPNSATNAIVDAVTSRTLTTSTSIGFYLTGSDGSGAARASISSSNIAAGYWQLPSQLAYRAFQTFSDADTTPSVATGNWFKVTNTAGCTVTTLDDGHNGQMVILEFTNGNTTLKDTGGGGSFVLAGSVDYTPTATSTWTGIYDGSNWFEVSRSAN